MTHRPLVQQLRSEHKVIARGLADIRLVADALPELSQAQHRELVRLAVTLFRRFDQHALEEERDIYPDVTRLLGNRGLAAAMTYDHRALRAASAELAGIDPLDSPRLQALLYGVHALLTAHMQKEEEIVFSMLEPPAINHAGHEEWLGEFAQPWEPQPSEADRLHEVVSR